jgi:preprotein translocase subunit YajC
LSPIVLLADNGGWLTNLGIWPALLLTMVLFYFLFIRPQARARAQQEKAREEKLKNLKKNDKVLTIGGIYGVVTHVEPDKNEIVIRVDDTNNTRLRMVRTSIHDVISEEPAAEPPKLETGT